MSKYLPSPEMGMISVTDVLPSMSEMGNVVKTVENWVDILAFQQVVY